MKVTPTRNGSEGLKEGIPRRKTVTNVLLYLRKLFKSIIKISV